VRRCLSIVDVNERVECLETGTVPDSGTSPLPSPYPQRAQRIGPSFDCRAARSSIERAICSDPTLSEWDSRMGRLFQQALQLTRDRQSLLENQRLWLVQRNSSCGADPDTAVWSCLLELTKARTNSLETAIATAIEANQTSQSVPPTATITSQARAETTPVGPSVYPTNSPTSRIAQGDRARNEPPQSEGTSFPIYFAVSVLGLMIAIIAFNTVGHNLRWILTRITANGLSSIHRLLMPDGSEDYVGSQRVEFRVRTSAEDQLAKILGALSQ